MLSVTLHIGKKSRLGTISKTPEKRDFKPTFKVLDDTYHNRQPGCKHRIDLDNILGYRCILAHKCLVLYKYISQVLYLCFYNFLCNMERGNCSTLRSAWCISLGLRKLIELLNLLYMLRKFLVYSFFSINNRHTLGHYLT